MIQLSSPMRASLPALAALLLAGCGSGADSAAEKSNEADDFAARINGGKGASSQAQAPEPAATAPGPQAPTPAEPLQLAEACNSSSVREFVGRAADDATRAAVMDKASAQEVRFVMPGRVSVNPDPTNPRLSVMLDKQGIIRDVRCG